MILKLLCRAHYEVAGTWEGFPYNNMLQEESEKNGTSPVREFYKLLGYKDDGVAPSEERYTLRKHHTRGETPALVKKLNVSGASKVNSVLKAIGAQTGKGKVKPVESVKWSSIVRVLADYLMTEESLVLNVNKVPTVLGDYLTGIALRGEQAVETALSSDSLVAPVMALFPEFVSSKELPSVSQGYLFSDFKVNEKNVKELVRSVIAQCLTKNLDLPSGIYFGVITEIVSYQISGDERYLRWLDWAHMLGVTVKEMIEMCGLVYVDRMDYYKEHKIFPYGASGNFLVFSEKSDDASKYIKVTSEQLVNLASTKSLQTLEFSAEGPTIHLGERFLLSSVYPGGPKDFTRGEIS